MNNMWINLLLANEVAKSNGSNAVAIGILVGLGICLVAGLVLFILWMFWK